MLFQPFDFHSVTEKSSTETIRNRGWDTLIYYSIFFAQYFSVGRVQLISCWVLKDSMFSCPFVTRCKFLAIDYVGSFYVRGKIMQILNVVNIKFL